MKKFQVLMITLLSVSIMTAVNVCAEEKNPNPCKKDIAKFCKNVEPGEGRYLRCLTLSKDDLTPACKEHLTRIEKAVEEVQNACVDDYAIYCSSVLPGQGRIAACLEKNKKTLTPQCAASLKEIKQKAREIQEQIQKK